MGSVSPVALIQMAPPQLPHLPPFFSIFWLSFQKRLDKMAAFPYLHFSLSQSPPGHSLPVLLWDSDLQLTEDIPIMDVEVWGPEAVALHSCPLSLLFLLPFVFFPTALVPFLAAVTKT